MLQLFRLDANTTTLVIRSQNNALPEVIYWGSPLCNDEDLQQLSHNNMTPIGQTMLDSHTHLSVCPEAGKAFPGHPGIKGAFEDGTGWCSQFKLCDVAENTDSLKFICKDPVSNLVLKIEITLTRDTGVVSLNSQLENHADKTYQLDWLGCPALPADQHCANMRGYHGRWCQEFRPQDIPWRKGAHIRENTLGRTSHEHFPGLLVPADNCTENEGDVWGWHLGWSGNHKMVAEMLPDGRRQVQFGVLHHSHEVSLKPGNVYRTPTLFAAYSEQGFNGLSLAFHAHCRQLMNPPAWLSQRPVHYNCWEAVYFDHKLEQLKTMVDQAAESGAEMFVLDDGWFHNRHDDHAGLGDWWPDKTKYPEGLHPLVNYVNQQGLQFGLWVEPEMVNRDSELFRNHPEWVQQIAGYEEVIGRNQYILDLSQQAVVDYLYGCLDKLLTEYNISYLKWDMNRSASLAANPQGQSISYQQTLGLYSLLKRVKKAHPDVVIESCCSGGGRIDMEILQYCDRVWLSDSNDAHERWQMQHYASQFFPPEVIGSHVGPKVCHTSGRQLSMEFRAMTAATRHMGFELDPAEMTSDEQRVLKHWAQWYKDNRSWLHKAKTCRLAHSDPNLFAELSMADDDNQFIIMAGQLALQPNASSLPLKFAGVDVNQKYRIRLKNTQIISNNANLWFESPLLSDEGMILSGKSLLKQGLHLPNAYPHTIWLISGERLE